MRKVIHSYINNIADMKAFLENFNLSDEGVIIKPNWTSQDYGFYTDTESLEPLLSNIGGKKYIVESYMYGRTDGTIKIDSTNAFQNWEYLKEQDHRFLETSGMGEMLNKYNTEYINITEECWAGRAADSSEIQRIVENKYKPINHTELYGMIPQRLMKLRHLPFISYSKIKYTLPSVSNFSSLSMKNIFGLIPVPNREFYHGSDSDSGLSKSIVDILTIYKALFRVVGICEGIYRIPITREDGKNKYKMLWTDYDLIENMGIIIGSNDVVTLDAYTNKLIGLNTDTRAVLKIGEEVFGKWDRNELDYITEDMIRPFK